MENAYEIERHQQQTLREISNLDLFCYKVLNCSNGGGNENDNTNENATNTDVSFPGWISTDAEIQAAFDEIRHLKERIIENETLHLFHQCVLHDHLSSVEDSVTQDAALRDMKSQLSTIKERRRIVQEEHLSAACREVGEAHAMLDRAKKAVEQEQNRRIEKAHDRDLDQLLRDRDFNRIDNLVEQHVDQLGTNACIRLLHALEEEEIRLSHIQDNCNYRIDDVRTIVENSDAVLRGKQHRLQEIRKKLDRIKTKNPRASKKLRKEYYDSLNVVEALTSLVGLQVKEVRPDGFSFTIDGRKFNTDLTSESIRNNNNNNIDDDDDNDFTHVLDIVLQQDEEGDTGNAKGENQTTVKDYVLTPPDVTIDVKGSPLIWAVQGIMSELASVERNRFTSADQRTI